MGDNTNEPHCKHFVVRKKRYCKMTVKVGEEYCGEHKPDTGISNDTEQQSTKRIPCPYDPKHTCFSNKLKQHLKKCNAKPTTLPLYIHKDINAGEINNGTSSKSRLLANVPVSQLLEVIAKVNKVHNDVIKNSILEKQLNHPILEEELSNPQYGNSTKKHLIQTSAIIGLMKEYNLLQNDTCYIEFGAGKGKLSYWVAKTLENLNLSSSVLLVERASHRHKYDNKLDKTKGQVLRIRADIADLVLAKVDSVNKTKQIVGLTKHLCGDATDLALRCLINCQQAGNRISGVIMAFCCHHRCQWGSYAGKKFFEEVGLSESDFDVMCGLVSWAVCGTGQSRERRQNPEVLPEQNKRDVEIGLNRIQKEEVGKKCKDILNWGRKDFLQVHGFKSTLCYYVESDVSLENVCVVGIC